MKGYAEFKGLVGGGSYQVGVSGRGDVAHGAAMTDEQIRHHIELLRSIERKTVHLPIATVERLMATGHKVSVGAVDKKALAKGKIKPAEKGVSVSRRIGRKAKADRQERAWKATGLAPSDAFARGFKYYGALKLDDCPFDGRTKQGKDWKAGWTTAAKEARKAARKAKA